MSSNKRCKRQSNGTVNSWENDVSSILSKSRVLVTGATGFLGYHLCKTLVALGTEVYGLSRSADTTRLPEDVAPVSADLRQFDATQSAVADIKADFIFHLAGVVIVRRDSELILPTLHGNLIGTVHILLSALHTGCSRLLLVGSSEEPTGDEAPAIPTSPYAAAKMAASSYGRMFHCLYGLPVVIVKPFLTYGPRQSDTKLVPYTILSLLRRESPQFSSGKRVCDVIYVDDVVQGMLRTAAVSGFPNGQGLDLGSGKAVTVRQIVETIHDLIGSNIQLNFGALPDRAAEMSLIADMERTRELLNWRPAWSLQDGLKKTIEWYRHRLWRTGVDNVNNNEKK